ncbi:Smr domain containing protein [Entamoeba histolytica HM-1:IMSS-B]|uniref:Smr domain-containing protein n=6 Tax=Entamoeba histolytica TaxID=5759 RepID=C4LYK2_ENTH1|nr:hypothetical protein EHI_118400 [Entamoeba histolytica HM-1:IMSS]EMD44676.1 Smr domain containing protein [Entamoeba histolytica KU27]EMH73770.1 Smr domain containing protein [Entamoeba histolytica HM-1:IMSS-B]EMS13221.1 Smr domain containing protein [Entamoeba histolytica HM-3:IMSS]ENY62595.1 Smr domain containing protein [Entamoeba histolytica HM-1:IMSS-A]GAT93905.1 hypothetical protein CL6EHI_118400 [Entamoeba histolytica]|eukprot:XP_649902.1 hypothetical protein EHI_118400 [Entamoeba histolytica HM-1:IMSS]
MPPKYSIKQKGKKTYQLDELDEYIENLPPPPSKSKPKKEKIPLKLRRLCELENIFPQIDSGLLEMLLEENQLDVNKTAEALIIQQSNYVPSMHQKKQLKQLSPNEISSKKWQKYSYDMQHPKSIEGEFGHTLSQIVEESNDPSFSQEQGSLTSADKLKLSYLIDLLKGIVDEEDIKKLYKELDGNIELILYVLTDGRDDLKMKFGLISDTTNTETDDQEQSYKTPSLPKITDMRPGESEEQFVKRTNNEIINLAKERSIYAHQLSLAPRGSSNANDLKKRLNEIIREIQFKQQNVINLYLRILLRKTGDHLSKCLEIDLHGFGETEAINALRQVLDTSEITGIGKVRFITGVGKHSSRRGFSVIKDKMQLYLIKNKIPFEEDSFSLTVYLN